MATQAVKGWGEAECRRLARNASCPILSRTALPGVRGDKGVACILLYRGLALHTSRLLKTHLKSRTTPPWQPNTKSPGEFQASLQGVGHREGLYLLVTVSQKPDVLTTGTRQLGWSLPAG